MRDVLVWAVVRAILIWGFLAGLYSFMSFMEAAGR